MERVADRVILEGEADREVVKEEVVIVVMEVVVLVIGVLLAVILLLGVLVWVAEVACTVDAFVVEPETTAGSIKFTGGIPITRLIKLR